MSAVARALLLSALACAGACDRGQGEALPAPTVAVAPAAPERVPVPVSPPAPRVLAPDASVLPEEDRAWLVARGLANPEAELIADLVAHPGLIPCPPVAGGTFGFHDPTAIQVLARDRAQAAFDDGHASGHLDLGFTVTGGKVAWKVREAHCTE